MLALRSRTVLQQGTGLRLPRKVQRRGPRTPVFTSALLVVLAAAVAVEGALLYRFLLQVTGKSADGGLSSALYDLSTRLAKPFRGLEPLQHDRMDGVIEVATVAAIDAYLFLALGLVAALYGGRWLLNLLKGSLSGPS